MDVSFNSHMVRTITVGDEEFDVDYDPVEHIDPYVNDEGTVVRFAIQDDCFGDYEWPEGVEFIQGNSRYGYYHNDPESWLEQFNEDPNYAVFPVGIYEHGLIHHCVHGDRWFPDMQWDYAVGGAIAIPIGPEGYTEPREAANSILEEYSAWCNGDVYAIVTYVKRDNGEWEMDNPVGPYIGSEWAHIAVKEGY